MRTASKEKNITMHASRINYWSHAEAIKCLPLVVTYTWLWRNNGGMKGYKSSAMLQALYLLQWWKGDEATLISEEIKIHLKEKLMGL